MKEGCCDRQSGGYELTRKVEGRREQRETKQNPSEVEQREPAQK